MTGSSLLNWDGSLTAQKSPDTDHSSTKGPNITNAALRYESVSRFPTPYNGANSTFSAVSNVLQGVSVSGINEVESRKDTHSASYFWRNPSETSSSPSSSHSSGFSHIAQSNTSTYNSEVTTCTIAPNVHCDLLGLDKSKDTEEELARLSEQTFSPLRATANPTDKIEIKSASRPTKKPSNPRIQVPKARSAQPLLSSSPISPSFSHISPLFTPPPRPKRRRMFMSHIAVPPLPGHKDDYRTMVFSRHGLLDRKAKVKAAGLIEVFGGLRAAYQEEVAMIEAESFSSSLRPSTTNHPPSRSYSLDDDNDIPLMIERNPSRRAEPSSSPKKRRKLSVEAIISPPPRKRSKKDGVHARAHQHTQSPAAVTDGGIASVIRDSVPKKPVVKPNSFKQKKQSVVPRTPSAQVHTKPVFSRMKSTTASLCSDEEPAMTFSDYYDDTLEHVRPIDARLGIYEYTMQDEDPVSEEVLSMNLRFIRSRLKGHHVTEDIQWYDHKADVDFEPTGTSAPLAMSAKAKGKQKAAPISPAKDIFLSPEYSIETSLGSDFVYLEGDHPFYHDPRELQPRVGPTMDFPHVHHLPEHDFPSLSYSSSQGNELLVPLHDFSSLTDNAYLRDSNFDLSHLWLETSDSLHDGTIDPSLLGGFESIDHSSLSSSSTSSASSFRDKLPSPSPSSPLRLDSPSVQIETEIYSSSRLLSPQCPAIASHRPQSNDVLDNLEMSDLTSLDESSPCINPISLDPLPASSPPSPKPKTIPVKVGPPARKNRSQWPMSEESTMCHQCRNRSFLMSVQCGCRMIYCVRCIKTKYDNLEFDANAKDFVCPKCNNACSCDICTRRRGEEYVSTRKQGRPALVSSRFPRKPVKSQKARDTEEMDTEDHNPAPLHRLGPAQDHHHLHVPLRELPHVSPLGGRTNIPPLSERKQGPVKYWGTIYSFTGTKIATAYIPEDGSSNTLLVQRSRVFVGEIQPVWGLGTNPTLRVVDPVKKAVENDARMTGRRFVGQQAPLLMPIRTIDSSGFMEYGSDADGEHDPEEPGDRLTPNDEHPGFEWRRGGYLDPDKISLADEDVTSVVIMSLKQIGITAMVSTE